MLGRSRPARKPESSLHEQICIDNKSLRSLNKKILRRPVVFEAVRASITGQTLSVRSPFLPFFFVFSSLFPILGR